MKFQELTDFDKYSLLSHIEVIKNQKYLTISKLSGEHLNLFNIFTEFSFLTGHISWLGKVVT